MMPCHLGIGLCWEGTGCSDLHISWWQDCLKVLLEVLSVFRLFPTICPRSLSEASAKWVQSFLLLGFWHSFLNPVRWQWRQKPQIKFALIGFSGFRVGPLPRVVLWIFWLWPSFREHFGFFLQLLVRKCFLVRGLDSWAD